MGRGPRGGKRKVPGGGTDRLLILSWRLKGFEKFQSDVRPFFDGLGRSRYGFVRMKTVMGRVGIDFICRLVNELV